MIKAVYLIANIDVTDPAVIADYRRDTPAVVAAFGGRFFARGGTSELLESVLVLTRGICEL